MTCLTVVSGFAPALETAVLGAGVTAGAHGAAVATVLRLFVRRYGTLRGAVLGLNGAGLNLGVFLGAALGGFAFSLGGIPGWVALLGLLALGSLVAGSWALRATTGASAELQSVTG